MSEQLTNPIAAHLRALIDEVPPSSYTDDDYDMGRDQGFIDALNFLLGSKEFASMVEQHTNGRITELESELAKQKALVKWFDGLATSAERTIARVNALKVNLFRRGGFIITKWEAARLVRTALEGEQQ